MAIKTHPAVEDLLARTPIEAVVAKAHTIVGQAIKTIAPIVVKRGLVVAEVKATNMVRVVIIKSTTISKMKVASTWFLVGTENAGTES